MQFAILSGLDQPLRNIVQQGTFLCPTGNCTWPVYESLAICNKCYDLTGSLDRVDSDSGQRISLGKDDAAVYVAVNPGTALRLPNGLYLSNAKE